MNDMVVANGRLIEERYAGDVMLLTQGVRCCESNLRPRAARHDIYALGTLQSAREVQNKSREFPTRSFVEMVLHHAGPDFRLSHVMIYVEPPNIAVGIT